MIIKSNSIHCRNIGTFEDIEGDYSLFQRIVNDMFKNAKDLAPIAHWHLIDKYESELATEPILDENILGRYKDAYKNQFNKSNKILDAWVGNLGLMPLDQETIEKFSTFLKDIDKLDLISHITENIHDFDWRITDMGTVMDMTIMYPFIKDKPTINVLEVGGGYGRLAEAFLNVYKGIKYVLVDAVPASIMFSYLYLKHQFSELSIGFYYNDDSFDMNKYDVYIIPAWHFEGNNSIQYDLTVNIESMQEMGQKHVDYYFALFDRVSQIGSISYISNAHDYVFKGKWNYPSTWKRIVCFNTPRSWSNNHPTEILIKKDDSNELINRLHQAGFNYTLSKIIRDEEAIKLLSEQNYNNKIEIALLNSRIKQDKDEEDKNILRMKHKEIEIEKFTDVIKNQEKEIEEHILITEEQDREINRLLTISRNNILEIRKLKETQLSLEYKLILSQEHIKSIENSSSWKFTKPMRLIADALKKVTK